MKILPEVNEVIGTDDTQWSVSLDGFDSGNEKHTIIVKDGEEAFKLKKILIDLINAFNYSTHHLEYRVNTEFESVSEAEIYANIQMAKHIHFQD